MPFESDPICIPFAFAQIVPWSFLLSGKPFRLKRFDGHEISYESVGFDGTPRDVFWGHYIEPFLEDITVQEIAAAIESCRLRGVDARLLLPELQDLLISACQSVFNRMAEVDQRLLGHGYPDCVPLRSIENELTTMSGFIQVRVASELAMWKPRVWYENWYERNKFWVWVVGTIVAVGSAATKLL